MALVSNYACYKNMENPDQIDEYEFFEMNTKNKL